MVAVVAVLADLLLLFVLLALPLAEPDCAGVLGVPRLSSLLLGGGTTLYGKGRLSVLPALSALLLLYVPETCRGWFASV
uniref:Putative secreted peptide n=1 Tax=Anopheles braziliensis TaxID=58242 RepID=A0A2M3ZWZ9_9DIPT